MAGIDNLTAALLSNAAYTKLTDFVANSGSADGLPNWKVDTSFSKPVGDNQFVVFVNTNTQQVVVGFKGTDTASQYEIPTPQNTDNRRIQK